MAIAATIGMFDGFHLGHRTLVESLKSEAGKRGLATAVVTFRDHPQNVLHNAGQKWICTLDDRIRCIADQGVDYLILMDFTPELAALDSSAFMALLRDCYGLKALVVGFNHRFGHNRTEDFDDYVRYGAEMGMEVVRNTPIDINGLRVSSSLIRRLLAEGNILEANNCLGHPYSIAGSVAHGFQEGRRIGFPTANIVPESTEKLVPQNGVYATRVSIEGGEWMPAMLNIGNNPTFQRQQTTIEAHIIGFEGDIYGRKVRVEFGRKLRDERQFESVEALQKQLEADKKEVERVIG